MGHEPSKKLAPADADLFRAFQSNLLSLISHELRTPLIGILNSLSVLDEQGLDASAAPGEGLASTELIQMARRNAIRLQQALATLLDLAELESGTFHARLREVDLLRVVRNRLELIRKDFAKKGLKIEESAEFSEIPVFGDSVKLGRALDLVLGVVLVRAAISSLVQVRISSSAVHLTFQLPKEGLDAWDQFWSHGQAGFEGGVGSPTSLFGGVLQSEQEFLSRAEEGFGSELILIHEILRLHHGKFECSRQGSQVELQFSLMSLVSEDHLEAVLVSRSFNVAHGLGSVALILINVPPGKTLAEFRDQIKASLFRASDAAYAVTASTQVALVLDDLKAEDLPGMMLRIQRTVGGSLKMGYAHCPSDVLDPTLLMARAESRLSTV